MSMAAGIAVATTSAAASTAGLTKILRHFGVVDVPVHRSLHAEPTARGGGLAILIAVGLGTIAGVMFGVGYHVLGAAWLVGTTILYGALGFTDDVIGLSARFRLAIQIAVGLLCGASGTLLGGWGVVWALFAAAAVVVAVNITNFMDGANGLVATHAVVAGAWFAVLGTVAGTHTTTLFALCLAGAAAGFLPFNAVRPKMFLGDVGSYAFGAALTASAMVLIANGLPVVAVAIPFVIYALDTGYTLQLRMRAGERWYEPHKLHVYQRLVSAGWSHLRVNLVVSGSTVALCLLSVPFLLGWATWLQVVAGVLMAVVGLLYVRLPVWVGAPVPWRKDAP